MSDVYDIDRIKVPDAPPDYEDHTSEAHYVPAPCQVACPVGTDAPSYIGYIWEEKWEAAFEAITATNPFSSICGRVCDAPCEPACRRVQSDGPLAIRNLKRVVMEKLGKDHHLPPVPVTKSQTIGIVGGGPAGLTAAHDLAVAGYEVHVYEMSDRLGGMMVWGIPAFRLPVNTIQEDLDRLFAHCPGIKPHLNCAFGKAVTLDELKERHDAVLLTIGAWWGKPMGIPGEDDERVVDGVGFLRRVNGGARPELPETVVVVGGGDVAMDACRVAKRLPGCKDVKVVYRRGPAEIPARRDELEGAVNVVPGSEHEIPCGIVIAAVGQTAASDELDRREMMGRDRVAADFDGMRTGDRQVFAAGDGAFGGSTIVMAMNHGQRAAYYIKAFLDGKDDPLPYRTPYRTRRVPVAQDIKWEKFPRQEQEFHGLGQDPVAFPEIESTYDAETAKAEAARCYRCDAETGSTDYAVQHREDIFSMARTHPMDHAKHRAMLTRRLKPRENPFPEARPATLDDLVFLPANLSRLVIDPYREACRVDTELAGRMHLDRPFFVTGFDDAPDDVRAGVAGGLADGNCGYIGARPIGDNVAWLQRVGAIEAPNAEAAALIYPANATHPTPATPRLRPDQLVGLVISDRAALEKAIPHALDTGCDFSTLSGTVVRVPARTRPSSSGWAPRRSSTPCRSAWPWAARSSMARGCALPRISPNRSGARPPRISSRRTRPRPR